MIPDIQNNFLRRAALVFTVVAIIVALGPLHLINAVLGWVEDEFDVNLRAVWRGKVKRNVK
ncbi:hypothetical protein AOQ73_05775 [Bradyrhizobium pachyrhizi]|uniref:hypothetical protein n=1 Tax=Bradyrhizobium pachyrhizi TaxID=280333 RepID=UPI000704ED1B|nr:hypothetical protein [Bradyrhizobium pachyrhizi]KRQ11916.1 hypothetical protein AOQ73_05775 [Bradyrhizobium pachyrhizi]